MLTLCFTLQSIYILNWRKGTVFTTTNEKDANTDRMFTAEDGLQFAIGIIDYNAYDYGDVLGRNFEDYMKFTVN